MRLAHVVRMPVTFLLIGQYVPLVLVPGILHGTVGLGPVVSALAVALCASAFIEISLFRLGPLYTGRATMISKPALAGLFAVGAVATLLGASQGVGSYDTQIGTNVRGPLAALATPFTTWMPTAMILSMFRFAVHCLERTFARNVFLIGIGISLVASLITAIIGPFVALAVTMSFLATVFRLIRPRTLVLALIIGVMVWPAVHSLRTSMRESYGLRGMQLVEQRQHSAEERLRLDKSAALVARVDTPTRSDTPSLVQLMRFGLVPRAFDPGRGELESGQTLNVALGGRRQTSASLTLLGNILFFSGLGAVPIYFVVTAVVLGVAMRVRSQLAAVVAGLCIYHTLWIGSPYPDSLAALLQDGASASIGLLFAWTLTSVLSASPGRRGTEGRLRAEACRPT